MKFAVARLTPMSKTIWQRWSLTKTCSSWKNQTPLSPNKKVRRQPKEIQKKKKTIKSRQESKYRCPLTVCCSHEILLTKQFSVAILLAELPALVMSVQYMRSLVAFTSWLTANGKERVGLLALHRGHALQCTEASSADVDPALHFRFTKHGAEQCDGDYVCLFLASVHLLGAPGGKKWGGW